MTGMEIAEAARKALEEKKAEDLRVLDVQGSSGITDFLVLASGSSSAQLKAMAGEVQLKLKEQEVHCYRRSGGPESGWVVLDYVDAIIHIFSPEARAYYGIEELLAEAREIPHRPRRRRKAPPS